MPQLVKYQPAQVVNFLDSLQISSRDDVKIRIRGGIAEASVKRRDGRVYTLTATLDGLLEQRTAVDGAALSPSKRRKTVRQLRKKGLRQTAIADLLGVSQATVSLDLRK